MTNTNPLEKSASRFINALQNRNMQLTRRWEVRERFQLESSQTPGLFGNSARAVEIQQQITLCNHYLHQFENPYIEKQFVNLCAQYTPVHNRYILKKYLPHLIFLAAISLLTLGYFPLGQADENKNQVTKTTGVVGGMLFLMYCSCIPCLKSFVSPNLYDEHDVFLAAKNVLRDYRLHRSSLFYRSLFSLNRYSARVIPTNDEMTIVDDNEPNSSAYIV